MDPSEVSELERYQVVDFAFRTEADEAVVTLVAETGDRMAALRLSGVIQLSLSRQAHDEVPFVIGETWIRECQNGAVPLLEGLKYGFRNAKGNAFPATNDTLYHFHLEGDIVVDIVCQEFVLAHQLGMPHKRNDEVAGD